MPKNAEKENDRQEKPVELKIKYKMPVLCSVQSGQGYMPGQPAFLSALLTALSMSLLTQWFASRFGDDGYVIRGIVNKSDVLAYFSRRNECEVVIPSDAVKEKSFIYQEELIAV